MYGIFEIRWCSDGYYWRASLPGRPGDQSDYFATERQALSDLLDAYPAAIGSYRVVA